MGAQKARESKMTSRDNRKHQCWQAYPGCTGPKPGRVIQEESSEYPVNSPHICTAESTRELEEKIGSRRYSDSMDMSEGSGTCAVGNYSTLFYQ